MFNKEKTYEFSKAGYEKAKLDRKNEAIARYMNIGIWSVMGIMCVGGIISHYGMVKLLACSTTSKVVKVLVNLK